MGVKIIGFKIGNYYTINEDKARINFSGKFNHLYGKKLKLINVSIWNTFSNNDFSYRLTFEGEATLDFGFSPPSDNTLIKECKQQLFQEELEV